VSNQLASVAYLKSCEQRKAAVASVENEMELDQCSEIIAYSTSDVANRGDSSTGFAIWDQVMKEAEEEPAPLACLAVSLSPSPALTAVHSPDSGTTTFPLSLKRPNEDDDAAAAYLLAKKRRTTSEEIEKISLLPIKALDICTLTRFYSTHDSTHVLNSSTKLYASLHKFVVDTLKVNPCLSTYQLAFPTLLRSGRLDCSGRLKTFLLEFHHTFPLFVSDRRIGGELQLRYSRAEAFKALMLEDLNDWRNISPVELAMLLKSRVLEAGKEKVLAGFPGEFQCPIGNKPSAYKAFLSDSEYGHLFGKECMFAGFDSLFDFRQQTGHLYCRRGPDW